MEDVLWDEGQRSELGGSSGKKTTPTVQAHWTVSNLVLPNVEVIFSLLPLFHC